MILVIKYGLAPEIIPIQVGDIVCSKGVEGVSIRYIVEEINGNEVKISYNGSVFNIYYPIGIFDRLRR